MDEQIYIQDTFHSHRQGNQMPHKWMKEWIYILQNLYSMSISAYKTSLYLFGYLFLYLVRSILIFLLLFQLFNPHSFHFLFLQFIISIYLFVYLSMIDMEFIFIILIIRSLVLILNEFLFFIQVNKWNDEANEQWNQ